MKRFAFLLLLLFFSSCTRYVCWIERTFKQAELCDLSYAKEAYKYVRSEPVYDYLNTIDNLYVLWINTHVFKAHEGLMQGCIDLSCISSKGEELVVDFEKKESDRTRFLILMDKEKEDWSYTLGIDGECYAPQKISSVELDRGYKGILGPKITRYQRNIYEVEFNVSVLHKSFSLQFFDGIHKVTMCWDKEC